MPVSSFEINPEKALSPDLIENQPDTKAAMLPVIPEDCPNSDSASAPAAPKASGQEIIPAAPVEIVSATPAETAPEEPIVPAEPQVPVVGEDRVSVEPTIPGGKKRNAWPWIVAAAAAALILVGSLAIGYHFKTYNHAVGLAESGLGLKAADDTIFLPFLTNLHDPEFLTYLEGQVALGNGDYDRCRELMQPLADAGYRDSDQVLLLTSYREARTALAAGNYDSAIVLLKPLARSFYEDSYELYCEARISYGLQLVENLGNINSVTDGLLLLSGVVSDGYPSGRDAQAYARELVYNYGIELYYQDNLVDALDYFSLSNGFADADKYITLCNTYWGTTSLEELWNLRDFANTEDLLLGHNYLCEFLVGTWKTAGGSYYYKMETNTNNYAYYCSYNLPWQYSGDFVIEDGVYLVYHNGGSPRSEFRISITTWNQICIYCFKNGNTYTLYRQ